MLMPMVGEDAKKNRWTRHAST